MNRRTFVSMLIAAGAATRIAPTAAGSAQISVENALAQLDGLQTAYGRRYVHPDDMVRAQTITVSGVGTPQPTAAPTEPVLPRTDATPEYLLVDVLQFETPDQVVAAFQQAMNPAVQGIIIPSEHYEVENSALTDLGDKAILFRGTADYEPVEYLRALLVQDGELGYVIIATGLSDAIETTVLDVARFMIDADLSSEPVTVVADEESTGGTFSLMPGRADVAVTAGLIPMWDYDLLLNGGDEPINVDH